jgi:hypothetical protein
MKTTIKEQKDFDAVLLMREIRKILNDNLLNMTFAEQREFFKRLKTDKNFAKQMIEKYKMQLTYFNETMLTS